ncbi:MULTISPECIES: hypothetical protein [unclassified Moorena]|nr:MULTISPECIES: hypothetical protein [unclassified Moorena]
MRYTGFFTSCRLDAVAHGLFAFAFGVVYGLLVLTLGKLTLPGH